MAVSRHLCSSDNGYRLFPSIQMLNGHGYILTMSVSVEGVPGYRYLPEHRNSSVAIRRHYGLVPK